MPKLILSSVMLLSIIQSCVTPGVQTVWKAKDPLLHHYNRILVVAIVPAGNDSLQLAVEKQTVQKLKSYGYDAVSYVDGFSLYDIAQLTQEAAYFTLCNKGIDCVITLAKCNAAETISLRKGSLVKYPASFYFNHIWNYRNMDSSRPNEKKGNRVWEGILFDLNTFEQQSVLQASNIHSINKKNETDYWIVNNLIGKMIKESMLSNSDKKQKAPLKSF